MRIFFIRHGIAENYADSDFNRQLTIEGRIKLNETFEEFVKTFKSYDFKVFTSPLVRAVQTCEILCEKLNTDYEVKSYLKGAALSTVLYDLKLEGHKDYILVGHEPYISDYLYRITGEFVTVSRGSIHSVEI
ncbi:SixA phosphatase family protein [Anaerosphaera multitolerans]|uniref:Histidine phosphatase family protein n=1 Tax=Anaerosphaera multitolerans TaxID=2487351 RepID=A0A437S895_9FIRM|nr:histidine phosphatase family protein [Anaerosphaera multitolerans]RVU55151.1 histidine phosphatase family protein [Anaerosphaera multitolerans]